jgi:uncharacterized protein GlcG (DUF336 family)
VQTTLDMARSIVEGARTEARVRHLKPLTVVVLDAGGHVIIAERENGASNKRFEIAFGKAFGAISLGMDSRVLMNRAEQQPYFVLSAGAAIGGKLVPVPGGVLIRQCDGQAIGVVGVSGDSSDNDELAARAGIRHVGLKMTEA